MTSGSSKKVVAFTTAAARWAGLPDLKMPEPTNTPSAPSCIIIAASAGVAMPPAVNSTTGSLPVAAISLTSSYGCLQFLGRDVELVLGQGGEPGDLGADLAHVAGGVGDVAGAGLALGADHGRALVDAAQRLTEVGGTADEGDREVPLVDVVGVVGRGQDLGLVDVVHAEGLQDLGLDEVADAGLGHDGDGHGGDDLVDHVRVRHAGHAALGADVGGNALERHDGHGTGIFGDAGLLDVDDVHDDAALEHLGHAALDAAAARNAGCGRTGFVAYIRCRHKNPYG